MSRGYEVNNISVFPTGVMGRLRLTYAASKELEQDIGRVTEYVMTPSKAVLATYQRFIARAVTYAHRDQLNHEAYGYQGVGYAFGNLYHSTRAVMAAFDETTWANNTMYVGFDYDLIYNRYGDALDEGRDAAYIPIAPLVRWIRMKKGVLKADIGSGTKAIISFAHAISKSSATRPRPAYLPGWTDMVEGTSTARSYRDYHERNKKYYVGLLTADVMNRFKAVNK